LDNHQADKNIAVGNFTGDIFRVPLAISKMTFYSQLLGVDAQSYLGYYVSKDWAIPLSKTPSGQELCRLEFYTE